MLKRNNNEQFQIRDFRNGDWLWISKWLLKDNRLTSSDKLVYSALASFTNENQECYPSFNTIGKLASVTEETVRTAIKKLEKYKYIKVIREIGKVNSYILLKISDSKVLNQDHPENLGTQNKGVAPPKKTGGDHPEIRGTNNNKEQDLFNNNNILTETNSSEPPRKDQDIVDLIDLFKDINPSYQRLFGNKTQRACAERLIKKHGMEKLREIIGVLEQTNGQKFAPTITKPTELEDKLGSLISFIRKEKGSGKGLVRI